MYKLMYKHTLAKLFFKIWAIDLGLNLLVCVQTI